MLRYVLCGHCRNIHSPYYTLYIMETYFKCLYLGLCINNKCKICPKFLKLATFFVFAASSAFSSFSAHMYIIYSSASAIYEIRLLSTSLPNASVTCSSWYVLRSILVQSLVPTAFPHAISPCASDFPSSASSKAICLPVILILMPRSLQRHLTFLQVTLNPACSLYSHSQITIPPHFPTTFLSEKYSLLQGYLQSLLSSFLSIEFCGKRIYIFFFLLLLFWRGGVLNSTSDLRYQADVFSRCLNQHLHRLYLKDGHSH